MLVVSNTSPISNLACIGRLQSGYLRLSPVNCRPIPMQRSQPRSNAPCETSGSERVLLCVLNCFTFFPGV